MPQGSHFWTTDTHAEGLSEPMWACEGVMFHVLSGSPDQLPAGAVPLYRFCDAGHERHFWTLDPGGEALPKPAFRLDLVVGYIFQTPQPGTIPLYRWYNVHDEQHFWGTDLNCEQVPWPAYKLESAVCHVYPQEPSPATQTVPVFRWRNSLGLHEWQIDIYRVIAEAAGGTRHETVARKPIRADDWAAAMVSANQLFHQYQPADGYQLINGRCESAV